jgi:hypothetical protein
VLLARAPLPSVFHQRREPSLGTIAGRGKHAVGEAGTHKILEPRVELSDSPDDRIPRQRRRIGAWDVMGKR